MDYRNAARELLISRTALVQNSKHRMLDEFTHGEYFVLNYLFNHKGKAYPKELSEEMYVSTARVAAILNQMEKKGWVTRNRDGDDNRKTLILLTEKGDFEIRSKWGAVMDVIEEMLKNLGSEDTKALLRIQRKIRKMQGCG